MTTNIVIVIIVTSLATYLSRFLGVISSEKIKENSKVFRWFNCLAYSTLAALISRIIIFPSGSLSEVDYLSRFVVVFLSIFIFLFNKKKFSVSNIILCYHINFIKYLFMIEKIEGFEININEISSRIINIDISDEVLNKLIFPFNKFDITALEYKPFTRFTVAKNLDDLSNNKLSKYLNKIVRDRNTGCFIIKPKNLTSKIDDTFLVKLSTAVAHLIGIQTMMLWQENIMHDFILNMRMKVTLI